MESLPVELIYKITDSIKISDICSLRSVNRHFDEICQQILFNVPNFKQRVPILDLLLLPIQVLTSSQISGPIKAFPESLQVFILDTRISISPQIIKSHPQIHFIISLFSIRAPLRYHFSNYLLNNVQLFTTPNCSVRYNNLEIFKEFNFKQITLSHLEAFKGEIPFKQGSPLIFQALSPLSIERLVLDSSGIISGIISPDHLSFFQNIVYISSKIFSRHSIFPLRLCLQIKTLEVLHFEKNTRFSVLELEEGKVPILPELLNRPFGDSCRARCDFDLRIKRTDWNHGYLLSGYFRIGKINTRF